MYLFIKQLLVKNNQKMNLNLNQTEPIYVKKQKYFDYFI